MQPWRHPCVSSTPGGRRTTIRSCRQPSRRRSGAAAAENWGERRLVGLTKVCTHSDVCVRGCHWGWGSVGGGVQGLGMAWQGAHALNPKPLVVSTS